ncbi:MAG: PspC domain-containing protein [Bacteroidota bacterium]
MSSTERYRRRSIVEEFDTSLMYDDIEKIREREEEEEKDQNGKLGSAGMMAFVAGAALLLTTVISTAFPGAFPDLIAFLQQAGLPIIGFGALGYGFYKTLKLAFRQKELNFPALNVYRKTRPAPQASADESATRTRPRARTQNTTDSRSRTRYQRRTRTYNRSTQKKNLRRSRTNRVFSGVAGGIAEYTGISSALIRFAFVASMFMSGVIGSVFIYLLLSIVLPANYDSYEEVSRGNAGGGAGRRTGDGNSQRRDNNNNDGRRDIPFR